MLLDIVIIIFLMSLAIALILAEIFFFPGITLAGVGGAVFAIGGIVFAYTVGAGVGHSTFILSGILFGILFIWLLRSHTFNRIALNTDIDSRLTSSRDLGLRPGDEGITISRLAPIGKARIRDMIVEAKSRDGLIDEHTSIIVVRVDSQNVVVRPKEDKSIHA